jgi:hypothetical protein
MVAAGALPLVMVAAGAGAAVAGPPATDYQAPAVRNAATGFRPVPTPGSLAPVDTATLHLPAPVAKVAPIAPPTGRLRMGYVVLDIPPWLDRDRARRINTVAAAAEARAATFYDSLGFAASRSDRMAAATVGGSVVGAEAGAAAAIPLAMVAGLCGGVAGPGSSVPMMSAGLVTGTFALAGGMAGAVVATIGAAVEQSAGECPRPRIQLSTLCQGTT